MKHILSISVLMMMTMLVTACGGGDKQDPAVAQQQCILATGGSVDCAKAVALAETPGGQQALAAAAQKAGVSSAALAETPGANTQQQIAFQAAKVQSALAATEKDPSSPFYRGPASASANSVDPKAGGVSATRNAQPASVAEAAPAAPVGAPGSGAGAQVTR